MRVVVLRLQVSDTTDTILPLIDHTKPATPEATPEPPLDQDEPANGDDATDPEPLPPPRLSSAFGTIMSASASASASACEASSSAAADDRLLRPTPEFGSPAIGVMGDGEGDDGEAAAEEDERPQRFGAVVSGDGEDEPNPPTPPKPGRYKKRLSLSPTRLRRNSDEGGMWQPQTE